MSRHSQENRKPDSSVIFLWTSHSRSHFSGETSRSLYRFSHAKRSGASAPEIPPTLARNQREVAGLENWATILIHEAWAGGLVWLTPPTSQSSVVSQLTSRGTWRHLVPVWMTVTVEGRGRGSSATAGESSRGAGAEASESWLNTLTADGRGDMGGPVRTKGKLLKLISFVHKH